MYVTWLCKFHGERRQHFLSVAVDCDFLIVDLRRRKFNENNCVFVRMITSKANSSQRPSKMSNRKWVRESFMFEMKDYSQLATLNSILVVVANCLRAQSIFNTRQQFISHRHCSVWVRITLPQWPNTVKYYYYFLFNSWIVEPVGATFTLL